MMGTENFSARSVYKIQPRIPDLFLKRGFSYVKRPRYLNMQNATDEIQDADFDFSSTDSFDSNGVITSGIDRAIRKTSRQDYHGENSDGTLRKLAVVRSDEEFMKEGKRLGNDYWMKKTDYLKKLDEEKKTYFLKMSKS